MGERPVYNKDESTKARLRELLSVKEGNKQVLFGHLHEVMREHVIDALEDVQFVKDEVVLRQNVECSDMVYIINAGSAECSHLEEGCDKEVKTILGPGDTFGELAFMYQVPHYATITILTDILEAWALKRTTFQTLLACDWTKKYETYEGWLTEVNLLKNLQHHELAHISEMVTEEKFSMGDYIITEGELGNKFYIVQDGICSAHINGPEGRKKMKSYERGDHFGEIALVMQKPRQASIRADSDVTVISLTEDTFSLVFGSLQDRIKEQIANYPQYDEIKAC